LNLRRHEGKIFSQNGEDGVLAALFGLLGTQHRYCLEIACGDGRECNTRLLKQLGWNRLAFDKDHDEPGQGIHKAHVTAENINSLLEAHHCPKEIDLLSLDVDGNDWHLWHALKATRPRVVVVEYNASCGNWTDMLVPYRPDFQWDGHTTYFGASYQAFYLLGQFLGGFTPIYCEASGTNMFLVPEADARRHALMPRHHFADPFVPPRYGPQGAGHLACDPTLPWTAAALILLDQHGYRKDLG